MLSNTLQRLIIQQLQNQTTQDNWVITGPVINARECIIYKASNTSHTHDIAIKVYREFEERIVIPQYDAIEHYASSLNANSNKYRVPIGYGCFPEHGTFLMEWVKSPSLEWRLWRFFYNKVQQQSDIRRTFEWLREFHHQGSPKINSVNIETYQHTFQRFYKNNAGEELRSENKTFDYAMDCFDTVSLRYENLETPFAKSHGDFTPSNILIDGDTVTAIDFYGSKHTPVVDDIALQLSYIVIEYPNMLTRFDLKEPFSTWTIPNISLNAYGFPNDSEQKNFFLLIFLFQLLRRWLVINHRNKNKKTPLLDRWRLKNTEMIAKGLSKTLLDIHQ